MDELRDDATEGPRVVIGHDFSVTFGGAERVSAVIARRFPQAPFRSVLGSPEVARRMGVEDRFRSLIPYGPRVERHYRLLAPVHPAIVRARTLPAADVLFTSSYAYALGMRTANRAPHVCYCISPLRFAWSMTDDYAGRWAQGGLRARAFKAFAAAARAADRRLARDVTRFLAVSEHAARQIREAYGREAEVVWPPVDTERFRPSGSAPDDYYLYCGRLIEPYKRPNMVVDAFTAMPDRRLVIAGDGPEMDQLRERAGSNIEFRGQLGDEDLVHAMQHCRAAIFPSSDDFGLIPVEAMACGRPVLAYAGGGALETVAAGVTGEFFDRQDAEALRSAVESFEPQAYDPVAIRAHAKRWAIPRFHETIGRVVAETAAA